MCLCLQLILLVYYMNHLSSDDLIFHKVGDEIISAGFGINSILLKQGLSPILSFASTNLTNLTNEKDTHSDSDSDSDSSDSSDNNRGSGNDKSVFRSFKNLAVPLGLFTSHNTHKQPHVDESDHIGHISDSLYDRLLALVDYGASKDLTKTRKWRNKAKHTNKSMRKHNKK